MNQLIEGIRVEKEHSDVLRFIDKFYKQHGRMPPRIEVYKKIARGHLREDPNYYTKLRRYHL